MTRRNDLSALGGSFVWLLFFVVVFERFGDEYFSWWYVQHMLPYCTLCILYSIFNSQYMLSIPCYNFFNLVLPDQNSQWYQHLLTVFAIFLREQYQRDKRSDYVRREACCQWALLSVQITRLVTPPYYSL